jgi:nicotinamide riboside transporter PnuC
MRGVGPFSPAQKTFMTIGTSILAVVAVIQLIVQLSSGSSDWPFHALTVLAAAAMIVMVRRTATKENNR